MAAFVQNLKLCTHIKQRIENNRIFFLIPDAALFTLRMRKFSIKYSKCL